MLAEIINNEAMDKYVNENPLPVTNLDSYPDYLSLDQMREVLGGISKKKAFSLILSEQIKSSRVGRTRIIKKRDLIVYTKTYELTEGQRRQIEDILRIHYEKLFSEYDDAVTTDILEKMLNASNNYVLPRLRDGRIKSLFIGRTFRIPKQYAIDFAVSKEHQKSKRRFPQLA